MLYVDIVNHDDIVYLSFYLLNVIFLTVISLMAGKQFSQWNIPSSADWVVSPCFYFLTRTVFYWLNDLWPIFKNCFLMSNEMGCKQIVLVLAFLTFLALRSALFSVIFLISIWPLWPPWLPPFLGSQFQTLSTWAGASHLSHHADGGRVRKSFILHLRMVIRPYYLNSNTIM